MIPPDSFNLDPPPGFRGLHPDLPIRFYRRHLPHWRQQGASYFVTFRLKDSLPQVQLRQLKEHRRCWERAHPEPRSERDWHDYANEITKRTERWLDQGYGACHFREPPKAKLLADALRHYQDTKCRVSCLVVMPNHAHVVMKPYRDHELEDVLQVVKGYVSHEINRIRNATGNIWEQESYDRIVRDAEHLYRAVQYIGRNGRNAGLANLEYLRWIHPEWQEAGWDFEDQQDAS